PLLNCCFIFCHGISSSSRSRNFSRRVVRFFMAYSASAKVNWLMVFTGGLGLRYFAKFKEFFRGSLAFTRADNVYNRSLSKSAASTLSQLPSIHLFVSFDRVT